MAQRRILLLITDLEIGGTPTVVRELAIRLRPYAHVEVACLKKWGPVADQLRDAGVTVTALNASHVWQLPRTVRRVREIVRERQIDTLFSFLIHANFVAARAAPQLSDVRFIQSIQTVQPRPRWHWWLQGRIWAGAEKIVVPSRTIVDAASQRSRIPRERFEVIPNAVDPDEFSRSAVFQQPGVRAGYLGRLEWYKGADLLLLALTECDEDIDLHIFGQGPAQGQLEIFADMYKVRGRVQFRGVVNRPQNALAQMDVLWMPSAVEGFGLVLIEAMAAGVPVIAREAGGVVDVVENEVNGLLVVGAWPYRGFSAGLKRLRDDEALRNRLIAGGLRTVREKFSWDVVLPQYVELLRIDHAETQAGMPVPP